MRHKTQTFLGYQLPRNSVDAVCLLFNTDKGTLQSLYEFLLALRHLNELLSLHGIRALLQYLVGGCRVVVRVAVGIHQLPHHVTIALSGHIQLLIDNSAELLELLVGIAFLDFHDDKIQIAKGGRYLVIDEKRPLMHVWRKVYATCAFHRTARGASVSVRGRLTPFPLLCLP